MQHCCQVTRMYVGPLSSTFLLLSSLLIAKANYFPEKLGLEQMCDSVVKEVNSMDVEDLLEKDQLLRTAEMCIKYLEDVNPDMIGLINLAERRPERVRLK